MTSRGVVAAWTALVAILIAFPVLAQPVPVCGNSVIEPPETCDDGNLIAGDGCSAICQLENFPPDCTAATASIDELWPPNHKFAPVAVLGVTDADGDPLVLTVTAVAQDEPLVGAGDGNTCPDALGVGTDTASVRAERSGQGNGRVYHVAFVADDGRGGTCAGSVQVCVRHDHRPNGVCVDGGPLVDSTSGTPPAPCDGECGPEDCAPPAEDLAPEECAADAPRAVEQRLARARSILERAEHPKANARRLGHRAARHLRRAAGIAARSAGHGRLSEECADVLHDRLDDAAACAMCLPE